MAGVPHKITTVWEIGQSRRQLLVAFHQWCLKLFTINLTTVRFTGAFCIELSSLTNIRFLTNGGNFGATCSVLSTGPLSNVNFFFIVISCYFIYERNPNCCLVCRLLLNTIVPRQRGRFWMREPRPASRTIVDCQPFRYLFLRCLLW